MPEPVPTESERVPHWREESRQAELRRIMDELWESYQLDLANRVVVQHLFDAPARGITMATNLPLAYPEWADGFTYSEPIVIDRPDDDDPIEIDSDGELPPLEEEEPLPPLQDEDAYENTVD